MEEPKTISHLLDHLHFTGKDLSAYERLFAFYCTIKHCLIIILTKILILVLIKNNYIMYSFSEMTLAKLFDPLQCNLFFTYSYTNTLL